MGMEVDAFIEAPREGSDGGARPYHCFARLYLSRQSGLQLHILSGSSGDPPYQISDLSPVAQERLNANADRTSDPYEIRACDAEDFNARRARLKGAPTQDVQAALAALMALGDRARLVFWYWG